MTPPLVLNPDQRMQNRRQTYRHSFEAHERLRAKLVRPGDRAGIACEVLNLSLGGTCVLLPDQAPTLSIGDPVTVLLLGRETLPLVQLKLSIPSKVITLEQYGEERHCGINFLPIADPTANEERERVLWRFLLAEQRRTSETKRQR